MSAQVFDETLHPRDPSGQFTTKPAPESSAELSPDMAPARMTHEDHRYLSTEHGRFADGYTEEDVDQVLGDLEGAEMVVVWERHEDGMFTGDSEIVGRVGEGPWRRVSDGMWGHLTGQRDGGPSGGHCHECGGECVVEADGVSHHLTTDGEVDHDADADHVALDESLVADPAGTPEVLEESTPLLSDEPYENQDLDGLHRSGANIAFDVDDDPYAEDTCSGCGAEIDGGGADGLCGSCADKADHDVMAQVAEVGVAAGRAWKDAPDDPATRAELQRAAYELVETAVDHGDGYYDVDEAAIEFSAAPTRANGEALVAALESFDEEHRAG